MIRFNRFHFLQHFKLNFSYLTLTINSMKSGKLALFNLNILCDDGSNNPYKESDISCVTLEDGTQHCTIDSDFGDENMLDVKEFENFLMTQEPIGTLEIMKDIHDGKLYLTITRESLVKFVK